MEEMIMKMKERYSPDWRASDALCDCIATILGEKRINSILEFGPGWSSFLLLNYVKQNPNSVQYTSIDHDSPYAWRHQVNLKEAGLFFGTQHVLPLDSIGAYLGVEKFLPKQADLIIIDGPPDARARLRMFGLLKEMRPKYWIIDDTHRPFEHVLAAKLAWLKREATVHKIHDLRFPPRTSLLIKTAL